jgi:hypothetical protein
VAVESKGEAPHRPLSQSRFLAGHRGYKSSSDIFPAAGDIGWCRHLDLTAMVIIIIDHPHRPFIGVPFLTGHRGADD